MVMHMIARASVGAMRRTITTATRAVASTSVASSSDDLSFTSALFGRWLSMSPSVLPAQPSSSQPSALFTARAYSTSPKRVDLGKFRKVVSGDETNFYGEEVVDVEASMTAEEKAVHRIGTTGALRDKDADTRTYIYGVTREMMNDVPEAVRNILSIDAASAPQRNQIIKNQRMDLFRKTASDTGSIGVQVAAITSRLQTMVSHMRSKTGRKDMAVKRRIQIFQSRRRNLLAYIKRNDVAEYVRIIETLGLKPIKVYQRHNSLAPVSVIDMHPRHVKKLRKYSKSHYQYLYDVPTSGNLNSVRGRSVTF